MSYTLNWAVSNVPWYGKRQFYLSFCWKIGLWLLEKYHKSQFNLAAYLVHFQFRNRNIESMQFLLKSGDTTFLCIYMIFIFFLASCIRPFSSYIGSDPFARHFRLIFLAVLYVLGFVWLGRVHFLFLLSSLLILIYKNATVLYIYFLQGILCLCAWWDLKWENLLHEWFPF